MMIDPNPRQINYGNDARQALIRGANAVAKAVAVTLGPRGRHVVIDKSPQFGITVTKDGVTVAKEVNPIDISENTGAQLFKKAAIHSVNYAGDGTTTATVLAHYMLNKGMEAVEAGANPVEIARGMRKALLKVVDYIKSVSTPITELEDIQKVAYISCNNDKALGDLVAEVLYKVTKDGLVHVEESATVNSSFDIVKGMKFDTGTRTTSRYFVTDAEKMIWEKEKCIIIVSEDAISSMNQLMPLFKQSNELGLPLLVIAKDFEDTVITNVVAQYLRGQVNCCLVQAPGWGDLRRARLMDIAAVTGAVVFGPNTPMSLTHENAIEYGGSAKTVIVKEDSLVIIEGAAVMDNGPYRANYEKHVQLVVDEIEKQENEYEQETLKGRLASLVGGSAIIKVGGYTKEEIGEKKDRIDDAVNAVKCAMLKGIVPGGGTALLNAAKHINAQSIECDGFDELKGVGIVFESLYEPIKIILSNAGLNYEEIIANIMQILSDNPLYGYDAKDMQYVNDMIFKGIVDPALVTITALESAVNVSAMMLTTDCLINYHVLTNG
jgi:chaperonin GroEL